MSIKARDLTTKYCDVVSTDPTRHCYMKEILAIVAHSPNQLAVDQHTNSLFFGANFGAGEYVPAILDIKTRAIQLLTGVKDAFAIFNNPETEEMYFGGKHGIYIYSPSKDILLRLKVRNLDIAWLYIKKYIYFIKFPSLNVYYYINRTVKVVPELYGYRVYQFVFDKEDNIFFINGSGLFGIKSGDNKPILLRDHPRFLGIATDNNGYVHVCSEDGIFVFTKMVPKVMKVINVQGVVGITFDKANYIIYSDSHEITRLVPMTII